jgi:hypothetical protein
MQLILKGAQEFFDKFRIHGSAWLREPGPTQFFHPGLQGFPFFFRARRETHPQNQNLAKNSYKFVGERESEPTVLPRPFLILTFDLNL